MLPPREGGGRASMTQRGRGDPPPPAPFCLDPYFVAPRTPGPRPPLSEPRSEPPSPRGFKISLISLHPLWTRQVVFLLYHFFAREVGPHRCTRWVNHSQFSGGRGDICNLAAGSWVWEMKGRCIRLQFNPSLSEFVFFVGGWFDFFWIKSDFHIDGKNKFRNYKWY